MLTLNHNETKWVKKRFTGWNISSVVIHQLAISVTGRRSSLAAKIMCALSLSHTKPFTPVEKKKWCKSLLLPSPLLLFALKIPQISGAVVVLKQHCNCVVSSIRLKNPLNIGKKKKKKGVLSLDYFNDPGFSVALLTCISARERTCPMLSEMPWGLQYSHSRLVDVTWGLRDLHLCGMAAGGQAE